MFCRSSRSAAARRRQVVEPRVPPVVEAVEGSVGGQRCHTLHRVGVRYRACLPTCRTRATVAGAWPSTTRRWDRTTRELTLSPPTLFARSRAPMSSSRASASARLSCAGAPACLGAPLCRRSAPDLPSAAGRASRSRAPSAIARARSARRQARARPDWIARAPPEGKPAGRRAPR